MGPNPIWEQLTRSQAVNPFAIKISDVSKHYTGQDGKGRTLAAIDGITLNIHKGSITALLGKNGCGKSTLIKIVSGIIRPTRGRVDIFGNIMAFTDFGSGFHPELSGVENVCMVSNLYGVSEADVREIITRVAVFSELGDHMNMAVKNYSQGMFVRLSFALMMNLPLDIVLLDEALSVGDEAFRMKCYSQLRAMRDSGLTVVLVSHNFEETAMLCDRCVLLSSGRVIADGSAQEIFNQYMESIGLRSRGSSLSQEVLDRHLKHTAPERCTVSSVAIRNEPGSEESLRFNEPIEVVIGWQKHVAAGKIVFDIIMSDSMSRPVIATANYFGRSLMTEHDENKGRTGDFETRCVFPPNFFNHGVFHVSILATYVRDDGFQETVLNTDSPFVVVIENQPEYSDMFCWAESGAPLRTRMHWHEHIKH